MRSPKKRLRGRPSSCFESLNSFFFHLGAGEETTPYTCIEGGPLRAREWGVCLFKDGCFTF